MHSCFNVLVYAMNGKLRNSDYSAFLYMYMLKYLKIYGVEFLAHCYQH